MTRQEMRDEARRLRVDPGLSRSQLRERFGVGDGTLSGWLAGIPAPGWTSRPKAKDALRESASELRRQGWTVPHIAAELGVARSTAYRWTLEIPLQRDPAEEAERVRRHMEHMQKTRWEPYRQRRDADHAATVDRATSWVGDLTDREVALCGAVAYWSEGSKAKPWRSGQYRLDFINSDPGLIQLFLRYVELLGVDRKALSYRLSIHETADVGEATAWWAEVVQVPAALFRRPTIKTHNVATVRHNVAATYRGCLAVRVPKARTLYWEIEGVVRGIAASDPLGGAVSM